MSQFEQKTQAIQESSLWNNDLQAWCGQRFTERTKENPLLKLATFNMSNLIGKFVKVAKTDIQCFNVTNVSLLQHIDRFLCGRYQKKKGDEVNFYMGDSIQYFK